MPRALSFGQLVVRAFADRWLHARSHAVGGLIIVTFIWAGCIVAAQVLVAVLGVSATATPFLRLAILVFFLLLTSTWIVLAYEQTQAEVRLPQTSLALVAGMIAILPTIIIAGLLTWAAIAYTFTTLGNPLHPAVTDFTSCTTAGGVVLETSPRQCVTTDATFIEGQ